jgi:polyphosphate kinase 2
MATTNRLTDNHHDSTAELDLTSAERATPLAAKTKQKDNRKKSDGKSKKATLNDTEILQPEVFSPSKKSKRSKRLFDGSQEKFPAKLTKKFYEKEQLRLQTELVKLQYWVKSVGYRMVIIFEGRDAAGKGGVIKRITEPLNPRGCRVVALAAPSDREKTQWYFQRYVEHLPSAGEIVLFDRSWYNRAGVERIMGFCTDDQYGEFMYSCPEFERMLVRSGIVLLKYWFSVSDEVQERRFQERALDPAKRWKLSPMDLKSRDLWADYSQAKDEMFAHTNIPEAPWFTIEADDKKRARLNCIHHILSKIPYEDMTPPPLELTPRQPAPTGYTRSPRNEQFFVPQIY